MAKDMDYTETLKECNARCRNTLMQTLNITFVEMGEDTITAKMPVDSRVHQPDGVLHGGASVALAESVGSLAAYLFMDGDKHAVRGIEISSNHVKSIREGSVFAKTEFIHKGRTTQLQEIRITDQSGSLISICKLTTIRLEKKK